MNHWVVFEKTGMAQADRITKIANENPVNMDQPIRLPIFIGV